MNLFEFSLNLVQSREFKRISHLASAVGQYAHELDSTLFRHEGAYISLRFTEVTTHVEIRKDMQSIIIQLSDNSANTFPRIDRDYDIRFFKSGISCSDRPPFLRSNFLVETTDKNVLISHPVDEAEHFQRSLLHDIPSKEVLDGWREYFVQCPIGLTTHVVGRFATDLYTVDFTPVLTQIITELEKCTNYTN